MSRRTWIWILGVSLPVVFILGVLVGGAGEPDVAAASTSTTSTSLAEPTTSSSLVTTTTAAPASTSTAPLITTTTTVAATTTMGVAPVPIPPGWESASVLEVVDGDTIEVQLDGVVERLRLIGTNSPEGGECYSAESTAGLAGLILDDTVYLEPDQSDRDQFGRLLRYVWTTDQRHVNEITVEEGWAIAREYPPDTARSDELAAAQQRAMESGAGLWAPDACGARSDAFIEIVHIEYDAPGNDNNNLNGEWVEIRNSDTNPVDLTGWVLKDESASHRYGFPSGFTIQPAATVLVYTGCGPDTATALYWCESGSAVWNNDGDTGFLLDAQGNVVWSYAYG